MFTRLNNYLYWFKREIFRSYNPAQVYNDLAQKNKYESTIDYRARVASFRTMLQQLPTPPKKVLDLATGTGALIDALPNKKNIHVLGIDIARDMLSYAQKRFAHYPNIVLKEGDFTKLNFAPSSFDLIAITFATRFIPRSAEQLFAKNIAQWLKKDGIFIAVLHSTPFEEVSTFLSRRFSIPRGYNLPMSWEGYFTRAMSPYLRRTKKISLKHTHFAIANTALFFKKNSN